MTNSSASSPAVPGTATGSLEVIPSSAPGERTEQTSATSTPTPAPSVTEISAPAVSMLPKEPRPPAFGQGGVSYLYLLAAFVVVTAGVRMAQEILQLLLLSVFLAVVGVPVYAWLVQKKIASWLSLLIVISGLMLSTVVVLWIVMTSLADFTSRQDHYAEQLRERTIPLQRWLEKIVPEKSAVPVTTDSAGAESVSSEPHVSEEKTPAALPGSADVEKALPVATTSEAVVDNAQQSTPEAEAVKAQVDTVSNDPENATEIADLEQPDRTVATPDLSDLSPVFDPQSEEGAGWLQPRRVTVPPQSRRSWRELIASQFDPSRAISMAANIALSVSQIVSNTMLILLTVVFILLEASTFPKKLRTAFGDHPETQKRYRLIVERIRSYLVIKTAMSLLTGTLISVWLWLFGVPYAGLWGMLAFLLNYIPNIGSIIAAVPALMVAWLDLGWLVSVAAGIGYVVVNMGVGNILEPRVLGRGMGLSALVVFCSMVFWGWALGPVGMLLSVPLTMTARVAFEGFDDTRWLGTLLGDTE